MENGDNLTLTCTASGGPSNMFRWVKDSIDITGSTDRMLNITGVTADEGGLYECVVNNEAGNSSADINIYGRTCISLDMLLCLVYIQLLHDLLLSHKVWKNSVACQ